MRCNNKEDRSVLLEAIAASYRWRMLLLCLCIGIFVFSFVGVSQADYTASVDGTIITESHLESDLRTGGKTITITLAGGAPAAAAWSADFAATDPAAKAAKINVLLNSMSATTDSEWDKVEAALQANPTRIVRTNDQTLTITLPAVNGPATASLYSIAVNQTVTIALQPGVLADTNTGVLTAAPSFAITAETAKAVITGTITDVGTNEDNIVAGAKTIIITLTDSHWVADLVSNEVKRNKFLASLVANGSESSEWAKVINALKAVSDPTAAIVRDAGGQIVTITLPAAPGYNITAAQTINLNIAAPQTDLIDTPLDAVEPVASFTIGTVSQTPDPSGSVSLAGDVVGSTEVNIAAGGRIIEITLHNNIWAADAAAAAKLGLVKSSLTAGSEASEWEKVCNSIVTVARVNDNLLRITLPLPASYNISADQVITVNIAPSLLADTSISLGTAPQFTITATPGASISGTIADASTEADIVSGGRTIVINLANSKWPGDAVSNTTKRNAIIDALDAAPANIQWDTNVRNALKTVADPNTVMRRDSDTMLTITLPPIAGFNIGADQTITLSNGDLDTVLTTKITETAPTFIIKALPLATAVLSGTATPSLTEANIVAGGKTLIITLTNDIWASDLASNKTKRDALIDALDDGIPGASPWDAVIAALKDDPSRVVRTSDTVATITLPPTAGYNLAAPASQTISLNIPTSVLYLSTLPIATTPASFTITSIAGGASITGTARTGTSEGSIISGGKTIIITLSGYTWATDLLSKPALRADLFDGLQADGAEQGQWNAVIANLKNQALINPATVISRDSDTVVTITLPPTPAYNISAAQNINITVPNTVLNLADGPVAAAPAVTIQPAAASLGGTIINGTETDIKAGAKTLTITLSNDNWAANLLTDDAKRNALIDGLTAGTLPVDERIQWAKVITALKADKTKLVRNSNTLLTITFPATAGYDITDTQTITVNIPPAALSSGATITPGTTFTISTAREAIITGLVIDEAPTEGDIVNGGKTIIITLINNTWVGEVASNTTKLNALLGGFKASGAEAAQWAKVITALKSNPSRVVRESNNTIRITLPAVAGYNIAANQTINLKVPKTVLGTATADLTAAPGFTIIPLGSCNVDIGGTVVTEGITEADVIAGGRTLILTLSDASWSLNFTDPVNKQAAVNALMDGMAATSDKPEWAKVVAAVKADPSRVVRNPEKVLTITLPAIPTYAINSSQIINMTIPSACMEGNITKLAVAPVFTVSMKLDAILANEAKLNQLLDAYTTDEISVVVPKKYIKSVSSITTQLGTRSLSNITVLTDVDVSSITVTANAITREANSYILNGKLRQFSVGYIALPANCDLTIAAKNQQGGPLQKSLVKLGAVYTAPSKDLGGAYSLAKLLTDTALFTSISTAPYTFDELSITVPAR